MSYHHFTLDERESVLIYRSKGLSLSQIGKSLHRHPSSISWEWKRHSKSGSYSPNKARASYKLAKSHCGRKRKLEIDHHLSNTVKHLFLDFQRSPEEIEGRLCLEYGKAVISYQTIYRASIAVTLTTSFHIVQHLSRDMNRLRIQIMNQLDRKSHEYKALKRYWKLIQQYSHKLSHKCFYRPTFCMHLTNREILEKLLSYSQELREHYRLYQLLLFHFQEKQADHFFRLIEDTISCVNPIFLTVFQTFLEDKDKTINKLGFPYSNTKLKDANKPHQGYLAKCSQLSEL